MKRKPNKPEQEPRERPGSWEEPADPGGASSGAAGGGSPGGAGTEGTSGQSVHKSKFRQKSKQEQAAASKLRMEKRGEKLEAARGKLAKQKPPKKPGPVRRVGRAAGGTVHGFVHGKIYENEQENVGIEGAHRSELVGEAALRHGSRFVKRKVREHPAKAVQRAESKYVKGHGGLSLPHGRPGAPGNVRQPRFPDVAQAPLEKAVPEAGAGGGQDRGGRRGEKDPPPPRKRPGQRRWAL